QDTVFNTALRILGDEDLAADATQDAFISAFNGINSFRGGSFKAWLMRTVTNACYDELRRQKRRPTTPLEPDTDDGDEMDSPRWLADPNMTPDQKAEADELEHASSIVSMTFRSISNPWSSWRIFRAWTTRKSPWQCVYP